MSGTSFVEFLQLYFDQTAMTLKSAVALIAYLGQAVHLNFSLRCRGILIYNGLTVVGFLPVGNVECQKHFVGGDVVSIHK